MSQCTKESNSIWLYIFVRPANEKGAGWKKCYIVYVIVIVIDSTVLALL